MFSLMYTLLRCHSTVRALRNSCAPISGFVRPVDGQSRDLQLLSGQLGDGLDRPLAYRLPGGRELTEGALGERLHTHLGVHLVGEA